jgi:Metal binding domain of Ada
MKYATAAFSGFLVCSILILTPFGLPALAATEQDPAGNTPLAPPSGLIVSPTAPIKGDHTTGVYFLPGCPQYDFLNDAAVVLFATEEEAQRAGFHKAQNCP